MIEKYKKVFIISLLLFLFSSCTLSICVGAIEIPLESLGKIILKQFDIGNSEAIYNQQEAVLMAIRVPRVLLGILVGGTLGISGCAIQGIFRNPLAEPGLIGVSSGASLFAVMFIVIGNTLFKSLTLFLGYYALAVVAFIGALLTTSLLYKFSVRNGKTDITTLLLIGIAINALAGALIGLMTYTANDEQLRTITFWNMGSLGGANWKSVLTILPFALISMLGLMVFGKSLNAMTLGESQAQHLGINLQKTKRSVVILCAIGVGACVALSGIIGFLALLVPHLLRMGVSADHKFLLPASVLLGASLLVLADLIARTIVIPAELPIGILTAFMGVPMFIAIILKSTKERRM